MKSDQWDQTHSNELLLDTWGKVAMLMRHTRGPGARVLASFVLESRAAVSAGMFSPMIQSITTLYAYRQTRIPTSSGRFISARDDLDAGRCNDVRT